MGRATHHGRDVMSILSNRKVVWGHLALLAVIVVVTIAYILDARGVSTRATNLLLIQPLAVLIVILAAFVLPGIFPSADSEEAKLHEGETRMDLARAWAIILALGFLAFTVLTWRPLSSWWSHWPCAANGAGGSIWGSVRFSRWP